MRCWVGGLKLLLANCIHHMALFAQVKIEAVFAFISNSHNWNHLAAVALYILADLSPRLNNKLNSMSLMVMAAHFELVIVSWSRKVAILTQTKVVTICADKTSPDDWSHVAADALVLVVGRQSIGQNRHLNALKLMVMTEDFLELIGHSIMLFLF